MHHHPFQESFWSPSASTDLIPNFSYGLNVLHQKLAQSAEENSAIIEFLKKRIAVEEEYARQLETLAQTVSPQGIAFDRDVGAGLKKCFEVMRGESAESVENHRRKAENLVSTALDPLERFAARYHRIITHTKALMSDRIAAFEQEASEADKAKATYITKCQALQSVCPGFKHPNEPVWLDSWMLTRACIAELLDYLRNDSKKATSGKAILERTIQFWESKGGDQPSLPSTEQDWVKFCQALVSQGFIHSSVTSSFSATSDTEYIIRYYRSVLSDTNDESGDSESVKSDTGSLGGIFRWGRTPQPKANREMAYQDMLQADQAYQQSVKRVEERRMQIEEALFLHYEEMASLELERIQTIKQAFIGMAATMSNAIPLCKEMYDRMMLYQETLKPDKDVQFIVEQYRTGRFCPRPIIYTNHFYGAAMNQLFGVSLEEYARLHKVLVPPLISQGLTAIEAGFTTLYKEERSKAWTVGLQLDRAHEIRRQLNISLSTDQMAEVLNKQDVLLLTSLIRLYLMELPECLMTFELYDPMKLCYANQHIDEANRLESIGKLLATLPSPNFYTLMAIISHFHRLVAEIDDGKMADNLLQGLANTWSHILIRPAIESNLNLHDKHPQRLIRDFIKNFSHIFSEHIQKAHEQHANRRAIVVHPETVGINPDITVKKPSMDAPSFTSSTSSASSSQNVATPTHGSFDGHSPEEERRSMESASSPPRRTLLSFMRRSSSTPVSNSERSRMAHRPLLMPSSTTLFEDPDESAVATFSPLATQQATEVAPSKIITDLADKRRSRASSFGTLLMDDEASLDSFFKDEDS